MGFMIFTFYNIIDKNQSQNDGLDLDKVYIKDCNTNRNTYKIFVLDNNIIELYIFYQ